MVASYTKATAKGFGIMKTKLTLFLVVAGLLQAATGEAQLATGVTLTNLQGQVYNNITIDHTNKLGVIWKGADGSMGQIKYNELAMECWVKLNLSDSAKKYDEAIALQQEQEQKARLTQAEAAKQQAELPASAQRQRQLDAEVKQMIAAGMVEATAKLIRDFPEKLSVAGGWMDAKFIKVDSSYLAHADACLGFLVEDKNGDVVYDCAVEKELWGEKFYSGDVQGLSDKKPNPLVGTVMSLKHGDKIRLIGKKKGTDSIFEIEKIEMIERAANVPMIVPAAR